VKIGQKLENIDFAIDEQTTLSQKDLIGKKVIIYFYPKDDTPGCTSEAINFSTFKKKFEKLNVFIIGISKDTLKKHKKFKEKHNIKIELASDEDGKICEKFGVWVEKSMYGKKYMGIERSTFLFNENLELISAWNKVKVKGHVEDIFSFVNSI